MMENNNSITIENLFKQWIDLQARSNREIFNNNYTLVQMDLTYINRVFH